MATPRKLSNIIDSSYSLSLVF